ncbi:MAG: hypothetical protein QNJ65_14765 [Xenococcaceae cyanobacterium MO_234.B1]|nr:hypothetical protein [Xenococcaceae cyanobacterium MO_234.B1]
MTNSTISSHSESSQDHAIWLNLQKVISQSSGFKRWQQEQTIANEESLDVLVRRYLEETLETLAY